MDFNLNEEHEQLRSMVREFAEKRSNHWHRSWMKKNPSLMSLPAKWEN